MGTSYVTVNEGTANEATEDFHDGDLLVVLQLAMNSIRSGLMSTDTAHDLVDRLRESIDGHGPGVVCVPLHAIASVPQERAPFLRALETVADELTSFGDRVPVGYIRSQCADIPDLQFLGPHPTAPLLGTIGQLRSLIDKVAG